MLAANCAGMIQVFCLEGNPAQQRINRKMTKSWFCLLKMMTNTKGRICEWQMFEPAAGEILEVSHELRDWNHFTCQLEYTCAINIVQFVSLAMVRRCVDNVESYRIKITSQPQSNWRVQGDKCPWTDPNYGCCDHWPTKNHNLMI